MSKDVRTQDSKFHVSVSNSCMQDRREREQQDLELAKEIAEDEEEDDFP